MFGLSKTRRAFTIVELLVVISIIGVLIGMLFPAVQAAREAGHRTTCINNIKQLGLAMLHYESKYNYLPHNQGTTLDQGYPNVDGYSWISLVLPYIEGENIYNRLNFKAKLDYVEAAPGVRNNLLAAQQKINALICPSDIGKGTSTTTMMYPNPPAPTVIGVTNYKACAGSNWEWSVDPNTRQLLNIPITTTKGRNKNDPDGRDHGNGIICRNYLPTATDKPILTALVDIRDGQSHTFAIGEAVIGDCNYNGWYWFNGTTATCGIPLNYKNPAANPINPNDWTYTYAFRSKHTGMANFCMCDGSAKIVTDQIDPIVYQAQATIDAGELVNED